MATQRRTCTNFNHGKSVTTVNFCAQCGQKFKSIVRNQCDEESHRVQRKGRSLFCSSCGKELNPK